MNKTHEPKSKLLFLNNFSFFVLFLCFFFLVQRVDCFAKIITCCPKSFLFTEAQNQQENLYDVIITHLSKENLFRHYLLSWDWHGLTCGRALHDMTNVGAFFEHRPVVVLINDRDIQADWTINGFPVHIHDLNFQLCEQKKEQSHEFAVTVRRE